MKRFGNNSSRLGNIPMKSFQWQWIVYFLQ